MTIEVDHAALRKITSALSTAGGDFDETGKSVPKSADAGVASGILADILFTFSDCGSRLVDDAVGLATTADACNVSYESADSAAAERLLSAGGPTP